MKNEKGLRVILLEYKASEHGLEWTISRIEDIYKVLE